MRVACDVTGTPKQMVSVSFNVCVSSCIKGQSAHFYTSVWPEEQVMSVMKMKTDSDEDSVFTKVFKHETVGGQMCSRCVELQL